MSWFNFFKKIEEEKEEKFILVHNFTLDVYLKLDQDKKGKLTFYLYENKSGERKYEHIQNIAQASNDFSNFDIYREQVFPWSKGKNFSSIPSYWDTVRDSKEERVKDLYKEILKI